VLFSNHLYLKLLMQY